VIVSCSRGFSETLPLETSGAADSKKKKRISQLAGLVLCCSVFLMPLAESVLPAMHTFLPTILWVFLFAFFFAYNASGKSSKIDILFAFFPFFLKNIAYKRKTFASHLVQMEPVKGNVSTNRNNPC